MKIEELLKEICNSHISCDYCEFNTWAKGCMLKISNRNPYEWEEIKLTLDDKKSLKEIFGNYCLSKEGCEFCVLNSKIKYRTCEFTGLSKGART